MFYILDYDSYCTLHSNIKFVINLDEKVWHNIKDLILHILNP